MNLNMDLKAAGSFHIFLAIKTMQKQRKIKWGELVWILFINI